MSKWIAGSLHALVGSLALAHHLEQEN